MLTFVEIWFFQSFESQFLCDLKFQLPKKYAQELHETSLNRFALRLLVSTHNTILSKLHTDYLFKPHDLGRSPDLMQIVLLRSKNGSGYAQPRQLLPKLRNDVVQDESQRRRYAPQHRPQFVLQRREHGTCMYHERENRHHGTHNHVVFQARIHRLLQLFR